MILPPKGSTESQPTFYMQWLKRLKSGFQQTALICFQSTGSLSRSLERFILVFERATDFVRCDGLELTGGSEGSMSSLQSKKF